MDREIYKTNGRLDFVATLGDIKVALRDKEWFRRDWGHEPTFEMMWEDKFTVDIYDLYSGEEFLDLVRDCCIMNYDGIVADVFVDGYKSNLGLYSENGFESGAFKVDEELWLHICDNYKVEVNWANK